MGSACWEPMLLYMMGEPVPEKESCLVRIRVGLCPRDCSPLKAICNEIGLQDIDVRTQLLTSHRRECLRRAELSDKYCQSNNYQSHIVQDKPERRQACCLLPAPNKI